MEVYDGDDRVDDPADFPGGGDCSRDDSGDGRGGCFRDGGGGGGTCLFIVV